jgi:NADPH:quinone reductase-like Zn-dependent oxidoreductase
VVGLDFAGVVDAVPASGCGFKVGDEVFGSTSGSLAECKKM